MFIATPPGLSGSPFHGRLVPGPAARDVREVDLRARWRRWSALELRLVARGATRTAGAAAPV